MTKEIKELSNTLVTEIQKLIENIDYFADNDINFEDFEDDSTISNKKRLKKQETWYDQMYEKYSKAEKLVESEELFQNLFVEFQRSSIEFFREWKRKKEMIENKLNSFLLEDMKKTEKELKSEIFTEEYEKMNYEEYIINKKEWQRKKEEEETENRSKIVEGKLTKNEMLLIEKEVGRYVDCKI